MRRAITLTKVASITSGWSIAHENTFSEGFTTQAVGNTVVKIHTAPRHVKNKT